jgi:hypothetical protein
MILSAYVATFISEVYVPIGASRGRSVCGEVAFAHKVASQLLTGGCRDTARAPVCLESVRILWSRGVEELFVDASLARRAGSLCGCSARRASVDESGALAVLVDMLEIDQERVRIVLSEREHLGAV